MVMINLHATSCMAILAQWGQSLLLLTSNTYCVHVPGKVHSIMHITVYNGDKGSIISISVRYCNEISSITIVIKTHSHVKMYVVV